MHTKSKILARSGLPGFRFHDLSYIQTLGFSQTLLRIHHALGVPDAYIMQRGEWNSDAVLKQVYCHALSDQSEALNHAINDHFYLPFRSVTNSWLHKLLIREFIHPYSHLSASADTQIQ